MSSLSQLVINKSTLTGPTLGLGRGGGEGNSFLRVGVGWGDLAKGWDGVEDLLAKGWGGDGGNSLLSIGVGGTSLLRVGVGVGVGETPC